MIITAQILTLSDISAPFKVKADDSDFTMRVVLSQQSKKDNKWYLFFNKSLYTVKYNYEICDKNILAVIQALKEW